MTRIQVEEKMLKIGIPSGSTGFDYIVDFLMLKEDKEWSDAKTLAQYAKIGKGRKVDGQNVERSIRYAIDVCERNVDPETFKHYFGFYKSNTQAIDHLWRVLRIELAKETSCNREEVAV